MAREVGGDPRSMDEDDGPKLGSELRRAREAQGRSLAELSSQTRVPVRYLAALEQSDFSILPNRVFSIGYVRAYALALHLDEQEAVERFRRESPDHYVPLQAPTGVAFQDMQRLSPKIAAVVGVVLAAIIAWNVFQRLAHTRAPEPSDLVSVPAGWAKAADETEVRLGAPLPAPADQTTPEPYITPGLELQLTGIDPTAEGAPPIAPPTPVRRAFNPRGAVYGAPAAASQVVIQARRPAVLVVRASDDRVLFARQLAEGDAWRAPLNVSAVIDSNVFDRFDVYLNGEYAGPLTAERTPLAGLNAEAARQASQIAEQAAARAEAIRRAAAQAATNAASAPAAAPPATPAG